MTYQFERKINRFAPAAFYELLMDICDVYAIFLLKYHNVFRGITVNFFSMLFPGNLYTLCEVLKCGAFPKAVFTFIS